MKILIINYHFPPSTTAHSYRWDLLRSYFLKKGHSVDYICGGLASEHDHEDNIHRVNFPFTLKKNTLSVASPQNKNVISKKSKFISLIRHLYRKIFWPDGLWHWLPLSLYAVLKRKNIKYDLVIGYSPTFSALIAAYFYKKLNRNVKFVIDFGDPFSVSKEMPVNNYFLYEKLNYKVEKKIFSAADLISVTNIKTYELYREAHPKITKFIVVPHLVNIDDFYDKNIEMVDEKINIGYIGAFHKGIREPNLAMEKICTISNNLASRCQFNFYGPLNGIRLIESERIRYHGVVSRNEALKLMKNFNIIINVENESCPMTPSKIYECMATGKPILNFLSSTGSSSFCDYPLVLNIQKNTSHVEIEKFISDNYNKMLPRKNIESILSGKTLSSVGEKYLSLMGD